MPFKEWQNGQQILPDQEPHWFDFELGEQNGNILLTAPYTAQYGNGSPPYTATVSTTLIGSNGQVLSSAVPIATYQTGFDFQTTDTILTGGDTGIFWTVANGAFPASHAVDIDMRRIDSNNNRIGAPVTLVSDVDNLEQFRVGSLASGGSATLVAYSTYDAVSKVEQIGFAGFSSAGTPIAGETGTLDTFSSPGYDAFGFGTLTPSTAKTPSFVYLRALANNGSPDIGYETVATNGAATSPLTGVPLTYAAGSTDRTLSNWSWTRLDPATTAGNNLAIVALTNDNAADGSGPNLEVRVLRAGKAAVIDDVIPLGIPSTNLSITQFGNGDFVVGYSDGGVSYLREYDNAGDVIGGGSYALPQAESDFKIEQSSANTLLVAYQVNNSTEIAYDIFSETGGPIAYRADDGVTRSGLDLHENDSLVVKAGGRAIGTVVDSDAGAILVQSGGATRGSVLNGNFEEIFGGASAFGTIVNSSARQYVVTGAIVTGTVVNAGGSQSSGGVTRSTVLNAQAFQMVGQPAQDYNATLNVGSSQWLEGAAQSTHIDGGDQLVEIGGVVRSAVLTAGDQDVSVEGTSIGTIVNGGTQYVENGGAATRTTVNAGGTFELSGASTIKGLVVNQGGTAELYGDGQTITASGGTGVTLDGGSLVKESGTGTSLIKANLNQSGTASGHVEAASGTLEFGGTLSGTIGVVGDAGTSLIFDKAVSAGTTLGFNGSSVGAQLNDASDFHGTIGGFGSGDTLDLRSILDRAGHTPTLAYSGTSNGGMLTLSDGTHNASLALTGSYAQNGFHLASDGHGGSAISYG